MKSDTPSCRDAIPAARGAGRAGGGAAGAFAGGVGAIPGAAAGAKVGAWVLAFLGLKSLIEYLGDALPSALGHYQRGFEQAWGMSAQASQRAAHGGEDWRKREERLFAQRNGYHGGNVTWAAHDFAEGRVLMISAILMALMAYLTRGKGDKAAILAEIRNSPRLGPKVADWAAMNEGKLATHPGLKPGYSSHPRGERGGGAKAEAGPPAQSPSQATRTTSETPPKKDASNKDKSIYGEVKGRAHMEEKGFERISGDKKWNAPGTDDIWKNPSPPPDYVITEYKYGSSGQGMTRDGLQMSDDWLNGKNTGFDRLRAAVGRDRAFDIRAAMETGRVEKWLLKVDEAGRVTKSILDSGGKVIGGS